MFKEGIRPLKKWGQHFLEDRHYLEMIAENGELTSEDRVLEIGPGDGRLTEFLLRSGAEVIGVEIDYRYIEFLRNRFANRSNFSLLEKDFLKLTREEKNFIFNKKKQIKVISNLPYYISTPILLNLFEEREAISLIVVLLQKEVGERLAAIPGSRKAGTITLYLQYYATIETIKTVPAGAFKPKPKVDSVIVKIKPRSSPAVWVEDEETFQTLIRAAFSQRRKTLVNALAALKEERFSRLAIEAGLQQLGLSPKIRGEKMKLEEFASLCHFLNYENTHV